MDCILTSSSKIHFNILPLIFHVFFLCGNTATCSLGRGPRPLRPNNIVSSACHSFTGVERSGLPRVFICEWRIRMSAPVFNLCRFQTFWCHGCKHVWLLPGLSPLRYNTACTSVSAPAFVFRSNRRYYHQNSAVTAGFRIRATVTWKLFFLFIPQTVAICPKTFSSRVDNYY